MPALEVLHKAWSSQAERPKYALFAPALVKACDKVDEYYEKTTDSPAYIMAMCRLSIPAVAFLLNPNKCTVLNPKEKMVHFKKHWSEDLQQEVLDCAEEIVRVLLYFFLSIY